jgi:ABC-type lipoprotein export system ATPase subunit
MGLIASLRDARQATFILVTHDPIVVARCDRSYSVRDGKIIRQIAKGEGDKLADNQRSMMDGLY